MENKIFKFLVYTKKKEAPNRHTDRNEKKKINIMKILFRSFIVKETYLGNPNFPRSVV